MDTTTTPASDPALEVPRDESERALEAYDALPGDSEAKVDYGDDPRPDSASRRVLQVGGLVFPELEVEVVIRTPDRRTFNFREAREFRDESFVDTMIGEVFEQVADVVCARFPTSSDLF